MKLFEEGKKKENDLESGKVKDSLGNMIYMVNEINNVLKDRALKREKAININGMVWEIIKQLESIKVEIYRERKK